MKKKSLVGFEPSMTESKLTTEPKLSFKSKNDIIQKTILIVKSAAKSEKFGSPYSTFRMTDVFVFPFLLQNLTSDCIRFSDIYSIVIRILQNFQFSPFLESLANGFISLRRSFLFPRENFN